MKAVKAIVAIAIIIGAMYYMWTKIKDLVDAGDTSPIAIVQVVETGGLS